MTTVPQSARRAIVVVRARRSSALDQRRWREEGNVQAEAPTSDLPWGEGGRSWREGKSGPHHKTCPGSPLKEHVFIAANLDGLTRQSSQIRHSDSIMIESAAFAVPGWSPVPAQQYSTEAFLCLQGPKPSPQKAYRDPTQAAKPSQRT